MNDGGGTLDVFTIFGIGVGQQTVVGGAIILALLLFAVWRYRTRHDKYDVWGEHD